MIALKHRPKHDDSLSVSWFWVPPQHALNTVDLGFCLVEIRIDSQGDLRTAEQMEFVAAYLDCHNGVQLVGSTDGLAPFAALQYCAPHQYWTR